MKATLTELQAANLHNAFGEIKFSRDLKISRELFLFVSKVMQATENQARLAIEFYQRIKQETPNEQLLTDEFIDKEMAKYFGKEKVEIEIPDFDVKMFDELLLGSNFWECLELITPK